MLWGIPALLLSKEQLIEPNFWFRSWMGFLSFLFFAGAITLSAVASWWHLFQPLKFYYLLGLTLLITIALAFFFTKTIFLLLASITHPFTFSIAPLPLSGPPSPSRLTRLLRYGPMSFCATVILLLLFLSCLPIVNIDTHIYHLQIIQWSYKYPVVPGLANLFLRLGLGSAWFSLTSFFYLPGLANENFTYLNVTMAIWFFLWLISQWNYHLKRQPDRPDSRMLSLFYFLLLTYSIIDWEILRNAANSANYDSIGTVCTIAALCFLIEQLMAPVKKTPFSTLFVVLIFSNITFKISGIFFLLLIIYYLFGNRSGKRQIPLILLSAVLIIIPFLITNYLVTGYPLFPAPFLAGSPDWKVPKVMVNHLNIFITHTNRLQPFDVGIMQNFWNNINWIPDWFPQHSWPEQTLLLLSLTSLPLFFIRIRNLLIDHRQLRQLLGALFMILLAWLFTAPSPRFILAPLLITALLPICFIMNKKLPPSLYSAFSFLAVLVCFIYMFGKTPQQTTISQFLFHPANAETAPYQTITVRGVKYHLAGYMHHNVDNRCYNTDLPCIWQLNPYLEPRGDSLYNGFRMNPYPDSAYISNYQY